jgi:hypothetical protein
MRSLELVMGLPKDIEEAKNSYALEHNLRSSDSETFEAFATHYVMLSRGFTKAEVQMAIEGEKRILTGGSGDIQLDGIAVLVNDEILTPGDDINAYEEDVLAGNPIKISFMFVQATGRDFRRNGRGGAGQESLSSKIQSFSFGVFRFFSEQSETSPAINEGVKKWIRQKKEIFDFLDRHKLERCCDCTMYFVWPGVWREEGNQADVKLAAEEIIRHNVRLMRRFQAVTFEPIDQGRLSLMVRSSIEENEVEIDPATLVRSPAIEGIESCYVGFLPASALLRMISTKPDEEGRFDILHSAFNENIRTFAGEGNRVNKSIGETLADRRRRSHLLVRNNGITIIAKGCRERLFKRTIVVKDYQVVNGCQTSHMLFHHAREHGSGALDGLSLPVKLVITTDEAIIDDIILSANRQSPIEETQIVAKRELVSRLAQTFRTLGAEPGMPQLWLESRTGEWRKLAGKKEIRIVRLPDLTEAYASSILEIPHAVQRAQKSEMLERIRKGAIYSETHQPELYYIAGLLLWRARDAVETFGRQETKLHYETWRSYPAKQQLVYAMRLLIEPRRGSGADTAPGGAGAEPANGGYARNFLAALCDQKRAHQAGRRALQIIEEAEQELKTSLAAAARAAGGTPAETEEKLAQIAGRPLSQSARMAEMTEAVKRLATASI